MLRLSSSEYILVWVVHHIAADAWSWGILTRELSQFYQAYIRGEAISLPELEVQYADYSLWQRSYYQGEVLSQQLSYWTEHLSGLAPLELPIDYVRPAIQSTYGERVYRQLAPSLVSKLLAFSKESGVTAFMSYLALFKVLLYRYSSQLDVCVGTPISGRLHQETEGLIGFFVNTLALRTHLREGSSYRELLAQVKQCCLEGYSHQGVPFEKVVEQVVQERDLSRHPLFQVLFTMDRLSDDQGIELPGVGVGEVAYSYNEIKFDLSLTVVEKGEETALVLEYCKDLYRRDTIDRMLDHYAHLLESVLDQPDEAIEHLPMLGEQEKLQLLEEFQGEQVDYPQDQTVLDLFAEQVERCGESEALVCGSSRMSYATLDAHSNQLAHYLVSQGVGPESLVGFV